MVECQIILILHQHLNFKIFVQIVVKTTGLINSVLQKDAFVTAVLAKIIFHEFVVVLVALFHRTGRGRFILIVRHNVIISGDIHISSYKNLKIFQILFHLLQNLQILRI